MRSSPRRCPRNLERRMKLVIGIVRPEKAYDVLEALFHADVRGVSMTRVQGHGGELDRVETYRGMTVKMELAEKVRFEVATVPVGKVTNGPPWKLTYATVAGIPGGSQALEAIAKDTAGNEARSASIPVMVTASATGGGAGGGGGSGGGSATGGGTGGPAGGGSGGAGGGSEPPKGCGCNAGPFGFAAIALLALIRRRR